MSQHITSGFAEVNYMQFYYEVAGQGHPLTLIHGGLVDRRLWDDQFEVFAQHYRVIRYDLPGYGDSSVPKEPYSISDDLYKLLRFLNVEKTYVMGLSMGGGIAIDFTLAHPEMVDALIPVAAGISGFPAPATSQQQWAEIDALIEQGKFEEAVELENRMWTDGPNRTPDQVDSHVRRRVHEMNLHNYQHQTPDISVPLPMDDATKAINRLKEIHVPTLVLVGDEDQPYILSIANKLTSDIAGAQKVVIPNTAHHLNMEQPATFNRIVLDFLASLSK